MAHILNLIVNEWDMPITFALLFILQVSIAMAPWPDRELVNSRKSLWCYIQFLLYKRYPQKIPPEHKQFWDAIGCYAVFVLIISMYVMYMGILLARMILEISSDYALAGWIVISLCCTYSILFIQGLIRLVAFKANAIKRALLLLATYPLFCLIMPRACFLLVLSAETSLFSGGQASEWPSSHFWGSCIIAVPWLVYFSLSTEMKKWAR